MEFPIDHVFDVARLRYNLLMNKKAKKRLKESVQKEIAERNPNRNDQGTSIPPKKLPDSQKFTPRPDKKRG
jgi:hypothetical protein